ncbi:TetR/AcrR family transcriptional regulator [Hazenella sp. IB182357]|uniref:TetR/AcrR family transcriptional regulator n=1 Tax=Polycladospora coralii TaxID=2771432 RepID=A0A926NC89_9BACL|nr:TetR/AcrR family transcriptional regulator [Polycladospora coralii]MBD1373927.1 TetR/AcrR family transcriptional regulator [Polycladospora coralii]MBS7532001.1 TetR/AcrR family transcriptional regulator [Polycladospora coralii]
MRKKDENKSEAIFEATLQLLNEIGLSELSMSKIARRAQVSPATIYIYFDSKEDLLRKLYLRVKQKMVHRVSDNIQEAPTIRAQFEVAIKNFVSFAFERKDYFLFLEQFSNSPLVQNLSLEAYRSFYEPVEALFEEGKRQQLFRQVDTELLMTYAFMPIHALVKTQLRAGGSIPEERIKVWIEMSWNAISD